MAGAPGRSGRRGKETRALELAGTFRKDRHGGFTTPVATSGRPEPPGPLTPAARVAWDAAVRHLEALKALAVEDGEALYQFACLRADVEQLAHDQTALRQAITAREAVLARLTEKSAVAAYAELATEIGRMRRLLGAGDTRLRQGRLAIRVYLVELGLTPTARGRIRLPDDGQPDFFSQFDSEGSTH